MTDQNQNVESQPKVDSSQKVETKAYVPTYRIKNEFKDAVLKAIGNHPFNHIAAIMTAIDVEIMDHNTLSQVIQALGQFPYTQVASILKNVNVYLEQIIEE